MLLHVWPPLRLTGEELYRVVRRIEPETEDLGVEKLVVRVRVPDRHGGEPRDRVLHISNPAGRGPVLRLDAPADRPVEPLTPYWQGVVQLRRRGLVHPYELLRMLTSGDGQPAPTSHLATSPSTTWTATGGWRRSTGPTATTAPAWSSG